MQCIFKYDSVVGMDMNLIVGMDTKNMASHFFVPQEETSHNKPHNTQPTVIHWLLYGNNVLSLNSVKFLIVRSVENFNLPVFGLTAYQPASLP